MNQLQTLRGNLIRLRKYYESFYSLNNEAVDKAYLGYPFVGAALTNEKDRLDYSNFKTLFEFPIKVHSKEIGDWAYEFICKSADNNNLHTLSIFLLYVTVIKQYTKHAALHRLTRIILSRESFFISKLEKETDNNGWEPNA